MIVLLKSSTFRLIAIFIAVVVAIAGCTSGAAEDSSSIQFTGTIQSINGNTLVVGGFSVDITNAEVPVSGLETGVTVIVIGTMQQQTVIATSVVIATEAQVPDESTAEATEIVSSTEEATEASPEATEPSETDNSGDVIIVIEGPVEEINVNYITIFNIKIQVDPADEILTKIRIGDTIRVEGHSVLQGDVIVIVAINITIVNTTVIVINNGPVYVPIPANCRVKKSGRVTCKHTGH